MPFPKIEHCLLCEDVRNEATGATSLMAFYGITPNAAFALEDVTTPVARITIVFLSGEIEDGGTHDLEVKILDENEKPISEKVPRLRMALNPYTGRRVQLNAVVHGVKFPSFSTYTISLVVDGRPFYKTQFKVNQKPSTPATRN